jgi:hypothetical protein
VPSLYVSDPDRFGALPESSHTGNADRFFHSFKLRFLNRIFNRAVESVALDYKLKYLYICIYIYIKVRVMWITKGFFEVAAVNLARFSVLKNLQKIGIEITPST